MFQPTTDRDVRLSLAELRVIEVALRDEIRKRNRSITKATASRAAGNTIQHNVLDSHAAARVAARDALDKVGVAIRQIQIQNGDFR